MCRDFSLPGAMRGRGRCGAACCCMQRSMLWLFFIFLCSQKFSLHLLFSVLHCLTVPCRCAAGDAVIFLIVCWGSFAPRRDLLCPRRQSRQSAVGGPLRGKSRLKPRFTLRLPPNPRLRGARAITLSLESGAPVCRIVCIRCAAAADFFCHCQHLRCS